MANSGESCCSGINVEDAPLIDMKQAIALDSVFKVLANRPGLRILHALAREPGLSVCLLAERVNMKLQAVSNQLRKLVDKKIITAERSGNEMHYRILDPCVSHLLDRGLCLTQDLHYYCNDEKPNALQRE